jgi:putative Mn2+ efflux pump MntP
MDDNRGLEEEINKRLQQTSVTYRGGSWRSVDALRWVSFALLNIKIWYSGIIIGIVTFLASMTAIRLGKSAGPRLGNKVEVVGGLILIAIGIKIFLEHMLGA